MKYLILILIFMLTPVFAHANMESYNIKVFWLAKNIYWEARGEDLFGQLLVGLVTIERLESGKWGDTMKEVVTARKQFSWHSDGKSDIPTDKKAWMMAKDIAIISLFVYPCVKSRFGLMYYHNTSVNPYWTDSMDKMITLGNHIFYKRRKG